VNPSAIARFREAQSRLLGETFDRAWRHGVASYQPEEESQRPLPPEDTHPHVTAAAGVAALAACRLRRYRAPSTPDPVRRDRALEPATASLDKMADELHQVAPTSEHVQAAEAAARSGAIDARDMPSYADALAVQDWAESNAWRLNAGDSVAWAGEQAGYSEAADADGQLLEWLPEADHHVCADCEGLGALPPMPLSDWPTTPGVGDTACSVGCRCVLQVSADQTLPDGEPPALSEDEEQLVSRIAEACEPREPSELA
jgi:hypothetical protein